MHLSIKPLPFDPSALAGLSERLLRSHHENHYGAAVKRLNAIRVQWAQLAPASTPGHLLNGLQREQLLAANSMWLHELYFDSLVPGGVAPVPAAGLALAASFGSWERWREEFMAMGKALAGGSGWVLLTFLPGEGLLVNQSVPDHAHVRADGVPILALDMDEHAYHLDHGAAAHGYVDAFMAHIDWSRVYGRYQRAVQAASEAYGIDADEPVTATRLDVRRAGAYLHATTTLPGAAWRDPALIAQWSAELSPGQPVLVCCVHGHEVSQAAALRLRAAGVDARFLRGGIEAWSASGRPLAAKGGAG